MPVKAPNMSDIHGLDLYSEAYKTLSKGTAQLTIGQ